jgi:hypothetical protein
MVVCGVLVGGGGCMVVVMTHVRCERCVAEEDKFESCIGSGGGGGGGDHHNHSHTQHHWPDGHAHLHLCNTAGTM